MKKTLIIALLLLPMTLLAQEEAQPSAPAVQVPQFGYLSYNSVFEQMPDYAKAKADFAALKAKYDAEAKRAEDEFQRKFAEFLQGQKDFPASIMQKRQAELQDLMEKSITFRQKSHELLRKAEAELQQPVVTRLNDAIKAVGGESGLIFVLNTDGNACPFVHPQAGIDITDAVLIKLGVKAPSAEQPANP